MFGENCDLVIDDDCNKNSNSFSNLKGSFGNAEGANERDLTK
jgi:hypothetical protein